MQVWVDEWKKVCAEVMGPAAEKGQYAVALSKDAFPTRHDDAAWELILNVGERAGFHVGSNDNTIYISWAEDRSYIHGVTPINGR